MAKSESFLLLLIDCVGLLSSDACGFLIPFIPLKSLVLAAQLTLLASSRFESEELGTPLSKSGFKPTNLRRVVVKKTAHLSEFHDDQSNYDGNPVEYIG